MGAREIEVEFEILNVIWFVGWDGCLVYIHMNELVVTKLEWYDVLVCRSMYLDKAKPGEIL